VVHLDDFQRQRKSEPYSSLFGRKERVKDTAAMSQLNAFPFVFNFNRYVTVFRFCGKSYGAARRGILNRVEKNVQDHLLNLYRVTL